MSHKFRQTLLALTLVSSGMMFTLPASAAPAPAQQQTQAPGYYRMMLGNLEVTALTGRQAIPWCQRAGYAKAVRPHVYR